MGYLVNTKYSPSEIVYLGKDRVKIDGIHIDSDGLRYHVKPMDIRWNTVFKVKEEHLSKEPRTDVGFICDSCGKLVPDEETYHNYHGCCSDECELKMINGQTLLGHFLDKNKLADSSINISPTTTLDKEDFFRDITDEEIEKINKMISDYYRRFF